MALPFISIIIPAYNIENYLAGALESVLNQTYSNLEVVVVDDGSTDGTYGVAAKYAAEDGRVKVLRKENGGVTSARLAGVRAASGDWIGFVDGDDSVEPWMYQRLMDNALNHQADISHCGYRMVFPDGHVDLYYDTGAFALQDHTAALKELLSGERIEPGLCVKLFRASLFQDLADLMPEDIRHNEDLLMNYWLFKGAKRSVYEDVCPYNYILRRGSATTAKLSHHKLQDPLRVTKLILEDTEGQLQTVVLSRLTRQRICGASMQAKAQRSLILPYRRVCRKELRRSLGAVMGSGVPSKLKIMALWASLWPSGYGWVHRVYEKATGLDKIYDLD